MLPIFGGGGSGGGSSPQTGYGNSSGLINTLMQRYIQRQQATPGGGSGAFMQRMMNRPGGGPGGGNGNYLGPASSSNGLDRRPGFGNNADV